MRWMIAAAVGALLLAGADMPEADKAKLVEKELAKFQGTWQLVSAERDGVKSEDEFVKTVRVTIKGKSHSVRVGEKVVAHDVAFEIDPTTKPRQTTDTLNSGPDEGKTIRGIYKLEGDTLTSCVAKAGEERPTEFPAKAGSGHTLRVFKRVPEKEVAVEAELKRFEGTWSFVSVEVEGKTFPVGLFKDSKLVLKGSTASYTEGGATVHQTFKVDPTATPKTLDVTVTDGPDEGKTLKGIYKLEGDTYTVCIGMPGRDRPTEFVSKPESGHVFEVLKREKP